jgi:cleavage and polyadenylation specificity factor subunit 2
VNDLPSPKVILASFPDMESGYARELFVEMANNPRNLVIFTERPNPGTFAHDIVSSKTGATITVNVRTL